MPAVGGGSLFKIVVHSSFLGVPGQNRFYYVSFEQPSTISIANVVAAFENKVAADWEFLVHEGWDTTKIVAEELTSLANFFEGSSNIGPGTETGDAMPPFVTFKIRLNRATKETRSGWKRLAGVDESRVGSGILIANALAEAQALADDFADDLTPTGGTLVPCIVRETYTGDPPVLNPVSQWIYNLVSSATAKDDVGSQNTRKYSG